MFRIQFKMSQQLKLLLKNEREQTAANILEFNYAKKRIKTITNASNVKENSNGIIYWMSREQRVQDNWSFLFAQKLALKNKVPLYVIFFLVPNFLEATGRLYKFMLKGLQEVSQECSDLNIPFYLYPGNVDENLPRIVETNNIGGVVCDFSPLRIFGKWVEDLKRNFPENVPLCQVDGHNVVPCWEASNKVEIGARTIRTKITKQLGTYLTPFPPLVAHPHVSKLEIKCQEDVWSKYDDAILPDWLQPGYEAALGMLESFCTKRLKQFDDKRNDPLGMAQSNMSPWIHFGQISAQRCALEVNKYKDKHRKGVEAYCEQIIIRKELTDNYCFYNPDYDRFDSIANWAKETLNTHRKDKRAYVYTLEEFEGARTHEALWNAAQLELVKDGKMHGYMRMYWAKKILEWSESPEEAIKIGIYLNDKYSFDGRDPNGYVGVMWSICGVHDHGWPEREIFGKIRYMNYDGCTRKFDVNAYIKRWGAKSHGTKTKTNSLARVPKKMSSTKVDEVPAKRTKK